MNSAFNLGETILEPKIVRKVPISLPKRFLLTELVGNLQTYELGLTSQARLRA